MNGDKTLAKIAYANRSEQEERASRLELEKQELEAKCSRLEESFTKQTTNAFDGWEKVIELEKENKEYEQALEFYEDKGNYKTVIENDKEIIFLGTSLAQMDGGEVARKVLDFSRNEGDSDE